jgi:hypothetical protein
MRSQPNLNIHPITVSTPAVILMVDVGYVYSYFYQTVLLVMYRWYPLSSADE